MTTASSSFKTTNPDLATYIEFCSGIVPDLHRENPASLVTIEFPATQEVVDAALEYASGCCESHLLNLRTRLYRRIREVSR